MICVVPSPRLHLTRPTSSFFKAGVAKAGHETGVAAKLKTSQALKKGSEDLVMSRLSNSTAEGGGGIN